MPGGGGVRLLSEVKMTSFHCRKPIGSTEAWRFLDLAEAMRARLSNLVRVGRVSRAATDDEVLAAYHESAP